MKTFIWAILFLGLVLFPAVAEKHPKAIEIEATIRENGYESLVSEITSRVSDRSYTLNQEGYALYTQGKYDAALAKFKQAISADDGNSIAYYNAACVMALQYGPGDYAQTQLFAIVRYLYQAMERDWYWALQMMSDSDLDAVKQFSTAYGGYADQMAIALSDDYEWGSVYNKLNPDGTVENFTNRMDYADADMGHGYYCIIGGYVFEYMPFSQWGIGQPPDMQASYFYSVEDFLPEGYYGR